jgi:hypothetical protein
MIEFYWDDESEPNARIYRHQDGYPESPGVLPDLQKFFAAVKQQATNTGARFDDACKLPARFVVWQAHELARAYDSETQEWVQSDPLDFIGVGISLERHGDIAYVYTIRCGVLDDNGFPTVTWRAATDEDRGAGVDPVAAEAEKHVAFLDAFHEWNELVKVANSPEEESRVEELWAVVIDKQEDLR